jgi:hypothetical protein
MEEGIDDDNDDVGILSPFRDTKSVHVVTNGFGCGE